MASDDGLRGEEGTSLRFNHRWMAGNLLFFSFLNPNLKLDSKQLFITCQERPAFDYQTHIE